MDFHALVNTKKNFLVPTSILVNTSESTKLPGPDVTNANWTTDMQYILTEEEYRQLKQDLIDEKNYSRNVINKLCQMVADHLPLETYPGTKENPKPWGCVMTRKGTWYCDGCPVREMCQMPKMFSK